MINPEILSNNVGSKNLPAIPAQNVGNYLVSKLRSFVEVQLNDLPMTVLKIIDLYLAKLDNYIGRNKDGSVMTPEEKAKKIAMQRVIHIKDGELEAALGRTAAIERDELMNWLEYLYTPIDSDPDNPVHAHPIPLFADVDAHNINGYWDVKLEMSQKAEELIFIPEDIHFLRYRVKYILELDSTYAYFLYLYLEDHRYKGLEWVAPLSEVKQVLGCEDVATYDDYRYFNHKVLKTAHKELMEKTDCKFSYEKVRGGKGGKVYAVRFVLEPKPAEIKAINEAEPDVPSLMGSDTLSAQEKAIVTRLRAKTNIPLVSRLQDTTIIACYDCIKDGIDLNLITALRSQNPDRSIFDYHAQAFRYLMDKYRHYESSMKDPDLYVLGCLSNEDFTNIPL